jgi:hypothetical protein
MMDWWDCPPSEGDDRIEWAGEEAVAELLECPEVPLRSVLQQEGQCRNS